MNNFLMIHSLVRCCAGSLADQNQLKQCKRHCRNSLFLAFAFSLAACGGGGSGGGETVVPATTVTVSGTVTYTDYNTTASSGLDFANPLVKPIRGAVVELQSPVGTVVATANTTETGGYSFTAAPFNSTVRVLVKAALGNPASPDTRIVDNTSSGALYAMPMDIITATSDVTQDFNAGSGWGGSSFTSARTAAPFAILDVIYQGHNLILAADSTVVFPALNVNWSVNNKPSASENLATGDIVTSHYSFASKELYILGAENIDTDEYDSAVIGHEWGHYFEANFSRSDSTGGSHSDGDILHPSVAFGEGFGTAFGAMVINDPLYVDTLNSGQATSGISKNLDEDADADSATFPGSTVLLDGYYSENSVMEVLYDLFDGGAADDDGVALGFAPLYSVLVDGQKNTRAFTSIASFLYYLRLEQSASIAAIDTVAEAENMNSASSGEFEITRAADLPSMYTVIRSNGDTVTTDTEGNPLSTFTTFGATSTADNGNKLLNHRFFRSQIETEGCNTLTVTALAPAATADIRIDFTNLVTPSTVDGLLGGTESVSKNFTLGASIVFAVSAYSTENVPFSVRVASTPGAQGC